jgi:hypothetical protein
VRVICDVAVMCTAGQDSFSALVRKEYEADLVPSLEMEFDEPAWKDAKKPLAITCSLREGYYLLRFPDERLPDKAACDSRVQMYRAHGWTKLGEQPPKGHRYDG